MLLLDLFDVSNAISQAFRTVFGLLCIPIYTLIELFYDLFSFLARAEILNSDFIMNVYKKVGLILGLLMTFKLVFSLIQSLVDPNKLTDKKNGYGALITRCIVSIVLLGTVPAIFREALTIQNLIIGNDSESSNIIYRLIVSDNSYVYSENFGRKLATELYFSFYRENDLVEWPDEVYVTNGGLDISSYETLKKKTENGDIGYTELANKLYSKNKLKNSYDNEDYIIEFDGMMCFIVGAFMAYLLLVYCIQTSIRIFQLAYLQLIAPIPIISYIGNPDGAFKKWIKQCTTTYLDLFMRLAIIYFVVYLANFIIDNKENLFVFAESDNEILNIAIIIFLLLGLFLFAKKVPDLIKDIFPMSKNAASFDFGLSPKKNLIDPIKSSFSMAKSLTSPVTKPIGWIGKKTLSYIDRQDYHLPKPRNKMQQWYDKLTPGRAAYVKNREAALQEQKQWNDKNIKGQRIYDQFNGTLTESLIGEGLKVFDENGNEIIAAEPSVFKNKAFSKSYGELINARSNVGKSINSIEKLNKQKQDILNRNDLSIEQKKLQLQNVEEDLIRENQILSSYREKLLAAQNTHYKNKSLYKRDADLEKLLLEKGKDVKVAKNGVFKHPEFIETFNEVEMAKAAAGKAKNILDDLSKKRDAIYNRTDLSIEDKQQALKEYGNALKVASGNYSAYEAKLSVAKDNHKHNQTIYTDDAETEKLFKLFKDTHPKIKEVPEVNINLKSYPNEDGNSLDNNHENFENFIRNIPINRGNEDKNSETIITAPKSHPRKDNPNDDAKEKEANDQKFNDMIDAYNAETDKKKKKEIMDKIDELERNRKN